MVEVMYNKRNYKVHKGVRGGNFIKVRGKKKYINLSKMMKKKGGNYDWFASRCINGNTNRVRGCLNQHILQSQKKAACDKFWRHDGWSDDGIDIKELRRCEAAITKEQMCRHNGSNNGHCDEWELVGDALSRRNSNAWRRQHGW